MTSNKCGIKSQGLGRKEAGNYSGTAALRGFIAQEFKKLKTIIKLPGNV